MLYRVSTYNHEVLVPVEAAGRMCVSNGPAFSPDGLTAYHVDSPHNILMEYNYRASTGDF